MEQTSIFASTLGLAAPWQITRVDISKDLPRLDIYINCRQHASLPCPSCGKEAKICGEAEQSWYHNDFFNKEAYLHVSVPIVKCTCPSGCLQIAAPWTRPGSRFTLLN